MDRVRAEAWDAWGLAREAAQLVEPVAHTSGLTLETDVPADPVVIESDARRVRQILLNLLGNAVRYTERGSVRLELREAEEGAVELRVVDTGIGIARENFERIFEPFWQVSQHLTRKVGGTGLGLSVSRRLARLMGGDVTVESEPGRGSTFTVRLPLGAAPDQR